MFLLPDFLKKSSARRSIIDDVQYCKDSVRGRPLRTVERRSSLVKMETHPGPSGECCRPGSLRVA